MKTPPERFECKRDDRGRWLVWDRLKSEAATLGGALLLGQSEQRATAACAVLSRIYGNGLDVASIRRGRRGGPVPTPWSAIR